MFFSFFLCLVSALLLILSFPPAEFSFFTWISLIPLFLALKNKNIKCAFWLSYFWGLIFWGCLLSWLTKVTFLGYIFLVLYLAIYSGILGIFIACHFLIIIPFLWVILEYLRTHLFTGFGWALLGYSQYKNLPLIQIADITGAYGVSFLIVLVNLVIYLRVSSSVGPKKKKSFSTFFSLLFSTLFLLSLCIIYGYFKIHSLTRIPQNMPIRLSLIQPNISPYQKWEEDFKDKIIEKYISLTQRTAKKNPALVVWPETSFPGFWEEERLLREGVLSLAKEIKTDILIGSPTWEKGLSYNSAILISDEGREISRYHKVHLVPFGEYLPFPKIFGFLQKRFSIGDYAQGKEYTIFKRQLPWTTYHFSILICFEDIFPNLVRSFVKNGAEFLINITEDGWYGKSSASFQHLQALVLRAVENRRYMVRSANTGYSCVINPWGKIVSELKDEQGEKLFITGVHTGDVFSNSRKTFYTLFGDWFIYLCFISFFLILYKRKKSLNLCLLLL